MRNLEGGQIRRNFMDWLVIAVVTGIFAALAAMARPPPRGLPINRLFFGNVNRSCWGRGVNGSQGRRKNCVKSDTLPWVGPPISPVGTCGGPARRGCFLSDRVR